MPSAQVVSSLRQGSLGSRSLSEEAAAGGNMMTKKDRYSRIEQVEMIGPEGLATLHRSTAAVLGVGNIGGWVAQHLVMAGVGVILLDKDTVHEENLGTQGFIGDHLGLPKVEAR